MKKLSWAFVALLSSFLISCDKFDDDIDFNDLLGTWGIVSYSVEGRPAFTSPDSRVSFYGDYSYVAIANNEDANGDMGTFSFSARNEDLTFAGNRCKVEILNETTLKINFSNNLREYCEITYQRVYPQPQNSAERALSGAWEQHFETPGSFWFPNATRGDFYLYLYPNGDFVDLGFYTDQSGFENRYSRFGHYTISDNRNINVYFGNTLVKIPIVSSSSNSLTLLFTEGEATYYRR